MAAVQLALLSPVAPTGAAWSLEGAACRRCADGRMYLVVASEPCVCAAATCTCLAEGYAKCDGCGALRQVWPREIRVAWSTEAPKAG